MQALRLDRGRFDGAVAALVAAFVIGCGSAGTPPAEVALVDAEPEPSLDGPRSADADAEPDMGGGSAEAPSLARPVSDRPAAPDNSVPDDYEITRGDCSLLGRHFGVVTRADETAKLNSKLNAKQRAQAEQSIDEAAVKMGDSWTATCEKSLVGKSADARSLKCALDAKTIKAFDACLNGDPSAKATTP